MTHDELSPRAFGASFRTFLEQAATGIPVEDSVFSERVRAHLGVDPAVLEVVTHTFSQVDRPNVQVALDAYLEGDGRSAETLGFIVPNAFRAVTLTDLIFRSRPGFFGGPSVQVGPVGHLQVDHRQRRLAHLHRVRAPAAGHGARPRGAARQRRPAAVFG